MHKGCSIQGQHIQIEYFRYTEFQDEPASTARISVDIGQLVSWLEFNVPFRHKYSYIREKRSGVERYPYPVKENQRYLNLNLAAFLFNSHPKRERDREAHLNYYAGRYNYHTARKN